VQVVFLGGSPEVYVADAGVTAKRGVPVSVPDDVAGRAPSGTPGEEGYDPGSGLLAQTDNWSAVAGEDVAE
jgi:hypothetical protein